MKKLNKDKNKVASIIEIDYELEERRTKYGYYSDRSKTFEEFRSQCK